MKKLDFVRSKKRQIEAIARKYKASNIHIFGSVARGQDDEDSDIDICLDMDLSMSLLDMGGLYLELKELLGCEISLVTFNALRGRFRENVLRDLVPL